MTKGLEILIGIDDMDQEGEMGTGKIASILARCLEEEYQCPCGEVSRHQLFLHPCIPYTSHNSSLCFPAAIKEEHYKNIIKYTIDFLQEYKAENSDPGFCLALVNKTSRGYALPGKEKLIAFGFAAKERILTKEKAYGLAQALNLHLSEHGGTGDGVIGALAGVGLRLSGNDGRFRGHHLQESKARFLLAKEIIQQTPIQRVKSIDGEIIQDDEPIELGPKIKSVLQDGESVLLVKPLEGYQRRWKTCSKEYIKENH